MHLMFMMCTFIVDNYAKVAIPKSPLVYTSTLGKR